MIWHLPSAHEVLAGPERLPLRGRPQVEPGFPVEAERDHGHDDSDVAASS